MVLYLNMPPFIKEVTTFNTNPTIARDLSSSLSLASPISFQVSLQIFLCAFSCLLSVSDSCLPPCTSQACFACARPPPLPLAEFFLISVFLFFSSFRYSFFSSRRFATLAKRPFWISFSFPVYHSCFVAPSISTLLSSRRQSFSSLEVSLCFGNPLLILSLPWNSLFFLQNVVTSLQPFNCQQPPPTPFSLLPFKSPTPLFKLSSHFQSLPHRPFPQPFLFQILLSIPPILVRTHAQLAPDSIPLPRLLACMAAYISLSPTA